MRPSPMQQAKEKHYADCKSSLLLNYSKPILKRVPSFDALGLPLPSPVARARKENRGCISGSVIPLSQPAQLSLNRDAKMAKLSISQLKRKRNIRVPGTKAVAQCCVSYARRSPRGNS